MTSFTLEDAIQLRNRLERCRETYRYEWESVRQRWQDLQYTWRDSQYHNFEPDFQRLIQTHDDVLEDLERQLQQLEQSIAVTERMNEKLIHLSVNSFSTPSNSIPSSFPQKQTAENVSSPTSAQESQVIFDQLTTLYEKLADMLKSFTKSSSTYLFLGLEILACINGMNNTQTVTIFNAVLSPNTVINSENSDSLKEYQDFLVDLGVEQLKKRREEDCFDTPKEQMH
jgi:hypothetical protein